jgi:hypothetical protein
MFVQNLTLKRFFSFFVHVQLEDQIGHFKWSLGPSIRINHRAHGNCFT